MDSRYFGEIGVIGMKGTEAFVERVDAYLRQWRKQDGKETYLMQADCPRFGTGEAKGIIRETCRGRDMFIFTASGAESENKMYVKLWRIEYISIDNVYSNQSRERANPQLPYFPIYIYLFKTMYMYTFNK